MPSEVNPEVTPYRTAEYPVETMFLNRWSPRAFSPEPVAEATLMGVFEAARWAASSYNEQPWRFLLARSEDDRRKFVDFLLPNNQTWAVHAPVLVLIAAKRTFSHNGQPNRTAPFDAGTCSGYMTLQASLSGLVAHGMAGFDREKARDVLHIPDDFDPIAVFALGHRGDAGVLPPALQEREVPSGRRPIRESILEGGFQPAVEQAAERDTVNTDRPGTPGGPSA